MERNAVIS